MPEIQDTVRPRSEKTGPVHNIGLFFEQWAEKRWIFGGIVLQVRILNDYKIARGLLNSTPQLRAFSHILRLQKNLDLRKLVLKFGEYCAGAVVGPVINTQKLDFQRYGEHTFDHLLQSSALVVNRHYHRKLHVRSIEH